MINPNVVGIPIPDYTTRVPADGGELSSPAESNAFSEVMTSAEAIPEDCDCVGTLNEVNLEILRRFNDEGLQFAFPTITVDYDGKQSKTTNTANPELVPDLDEMD